MHTLLIRRRDQKAVHYKTLHRKELHRPLPGKRAHSVHKRAHKRAHRTLPETHSICASSLADLQICSQSMMVSQPRMEA